MKGKRRPHIGGLTTETKGKRSPLFPIININIAYFQKINIKSIVNKFYLLIKFFFLDDLI